MSIGASKSLLRFVLTQIDERKRSAVVIEHFCFVSFGKNLSFLQSRDLT